MTNEEIIKEIREEIEARSKGVIDEDGNYICSLYPCWRMEAIEHIKEQIPEKLPYEPVCKFGLADCIYDPAYIKFDDPEWYAELYGDAHPNEVNDCQDCKDGSRYDDEDK